MSFHDTYVLQANVMAKLIAMIGDLNGKIALLTAATTCSQKSPLDYTTNAPTMPPPRLLLNCTQPSPQQHTVLELSKPKGTFTLHASTICIQLAPVTYTRTYKCVIPAKPPFSHACNSLTLLRTKDSMHPLN